MNYPFLCYFTLSPLRGSFFNSTLTGVYTPACVMSSLRDYCLSTVICEPTVLEPLAIVICIICGSCGSLISMKNHKIALKTSPRFSQLNSSLLRFASAPIFAHNSLSANSAIARANLSTASSREVTPFITRLYPGSK